MLPNLFDYETAPRLTKPSVSLEKITNLSVAVTRISGSLKSANTQQYTKGLERWIAENDDTITGAFSVAGYNPLWTLPNMRRNEVLIPVEKR